MRYLSPRFKLLISRSAGFPELRGVSPTQGNFRGNFFSGTVNEQVASRGELCQLRPDINILRSNVTLVKLALFVFVTLAQGNGQPSHELAPAKLIEAVEYEPCDYYCGPLNHPRTAYCIDIEGETIVGERPGLLWLGESDAVSMRNLVGKQVMARLDRSSIWISDAGRTIKVKRGSAYEAFQNTRCIVEVHRPKLASAAKFERPRDLPANAFPLAGAQVGEYRTLFLWFSCSMVASMGTIDCAKWYPKGDSRGVERYCTHTVDGAAVSPDYQIDHLASREGRLVLTSGGVLLFDHRGRINDKLIRPGEACY
jgi:hypothetical protein